MKGGAAGAGIAKVVRSAILGGVGAEDLERDLRGGGLVVFVRARDAAAEEKAQQIMRKSGALNVHVHEIELKKTLDDHGVEEIEALGKPFDPDLHEAVFEMPTPDRETGEVLEVQQKGFVHREFVVRPSLVVVAKKVEASTEVSDEPSAGGDE